MSFFIREDPLTDERCIIASVRKKRPHMFREAVEEELFQCPFCPENESLTPTELFSIREEGRWLVRVIPNKFSAIPNMHDVVIDSPNHSDDIDTIPHLKKLLEAYRERMIHYYNTDGVRYVAVFRNRGKSAGASIPHPHSQVVALPFYPKRFLKEKEKYERENRNVMENFLKGELDLQERVLSVSRHFCVLMAYAPTTPYEVWIVPKDQVNSFIYEDNLQELADILKDTISLLKGYLGENFPYNLTFQSAPPWDRDYHYYIRIMPRISIFGGFELETENIIVSVAPEEAVSQLRMVKYTMREES